MAILEEQENGRKRLRVGEKNAGQIGIRKKK